MTLDYIIDFTMALAQKQVPKLNEVQTLLNCSVTDLPRGNIIIQQRPGMFMLRVFDNEKGKALENKKVTHFLPGDKLGKNPIVVYIRKKQARPRYVNPKYITVWDTSSSGLAGYVTNEMLTNFFKKYGTILEPVQDVNVLSENVWALDKKKFRIDLDQQIHIPRKCPIEVITKAGEKVNGDLRVTYKDQPYFCRRCVKEHGGDCPKWMEDKQRLEEIKEQKARETETIIIGDSNLKRVNSNAILADVVSSSGAKIGHIANQMKFESIENYKNIVVFCGVNNIPAMHDAIDSDKLWNQVQTEITHLEINLKPHVTEGRNVMITPVPNAPHTKFSKNILI